MKEWQDLKIGDVLSKIIGGGTPSKTIDEYWNGNIPWCSVKDMSEGKFQLSQTEDYITELGLKNSSSNLIQTGTVITSTRMGLGRAFVNNVDMAINQDLKALIPNDKIDNKFLLWTIISKKNELESLGTGATVKGIRLETLKDIKIKLPPLPIQQRIASILSAYDDLIENNLKRIKLLEELAQRTYEEWFVKFRINGEQLPIDENTGLPFGWEKKRLVEIANLTMGQSPKSEFYNNEGKGLPFHQGVSDYGFRFPTNSTWSTEGNRFAEKGSILFSVRAPVGRLNVAIEKIILGRGLSSIIEKNQRTSLLFYKLQKIFFKDDLLGGGAIFNSVTKNDVERIEIIIGTEAIENQLNQMTSDIDMQIENLSKQNYKLKESRDLLLPRLMNGTIKIDEP